MNPQTQWFLKNTFCQLLGFCQSSSGREWGRGGRQKGRQCWLSCEPSMDSAGRFLLSSVYTVAFLQDFDCSKGCGLQTIWQPVVPCYDLIWYMSLLTYGLKDVNTNPAQNLGPTDKDEHPFHRIWCIPSLQPPSSLQCAAAASHCY